MNTDRTKKILCSLKVQSGFFWCSAGGFVWGRRGRNIDCLLSNVGVKNEWHCASFSPAAFLTCLQPSLTSSLKSYVIRSFKKFTCRNFGDILMCIGMSCAASRNCDCSQWQAAWFVHSLQYDDLGAVMIIFSSQWNSQ
jgi:hypothetical protein